ncbi:unnamed protein product [Mucor fragilis]
MLVGNPTENDSAEESDEIKLGRQMKAAYNDLVENRIPNPIVCGILAQGKRMSNYVMDMVSPPAHRFRKISKVDLCFTLRLIQLKNAVLETAILANTENMSQDV